VRESKADLNELQELLQRSHEKGGSHLRSIFDQEHRLTAEEFVEALDGIFEMHLATVAGNGAPVVAPVDGVLFKGKIWFGLPAGSVRSRLVRRDPRVSASYTSGQSFAFIVHGTARTLDETNTVFGEYDSLLRELYVAAYGPGWIDWYERQQRYHAGSEWFNGWIEPRLMFVKR
jgi:hypothetical protein